MKKTLKKAKENTREKFQKGADKIMNWIGSTNAIIVHTIAFVTAFFLPLFDVPIEEVLLGLTTFLSIEAVYLAIFIQIAVNRNTADIEEIQEDIEGIEEDVDEIQKDVDEIQEDIEEIEEESDQEETEQQKSAQALDSIQQILTRLQKELEDLKKK